MSNDSKNYTENVSTEHMRSGTPRTAVSYEEAPGELSRVINAVSTTLVGHLLIYDAHGCIIHMNPSIRSLLSLDEDISLASLSTLMLQFASYDEHDHILPEEQWPVARILRGATITVNHAVYALAHRADGLDLHVRISGSPLRDRYDHQVGAIILLQEVVSDIDKARDAHSRLNADWLDVNELLTDVVTGLHETSPFHQLHLQLAYALPLLCGNHEQLARAFTALLTLVIKCSPSGGTLCIASAYEQHEVHISVVYQGTDQTVDRLAQLLSYWVSEFRTQRHKARSIDKDLVLICTAIRKHGGQFWAESVADSGTTLHCTLPLTMQ